jgi:DNA-binding transcriptional ArsR family regulator
MLVVDIFRYGNIIRLVPRSAATSDIFSAVADGSRREILALLAVDERPVGDIVGALNLAQPSVSKHLKVLHDVGLVTVRREGRHAFYRTNLQAIRPLHEWTGTFERFWRHQLTRVVERAEARERKQP